MTSAVQPAPSSSNPFNEFLERYCNDPVRFVREVLGAEPDPWQIKVLEAIRDGKHRISIRSGHGVGKTALLAWIVIWFTFTRFPQKTVCTAATAPQLFDALYAETCRWINKLPQTLRDLLDVKSEHIELKVAPKESFISFRTSRADTPEALAGVHADNVLLIGDEASGIPEQVFEAASGSMSGHNAITLLAGNPVRSSGLFYDTHNKLSATWTTFRVSCADSPRVRPGYLPEMAERYGENSNAYRVRVLGEFPLADEDTVIPAEWMDAALTRDVRPTAVRPLWGLDCARGGRADSALAKRRGNVLTEPVKTWHGLDTMELVGRIKAEYDATKLDDRPEEILVDVIGVGAGVTDRLRELNLPARGINVSESPALSQYYRDLKAELWWTAREWFEARDCNLCGDIETGQQLIAVRLGYTSSGKKSIEDKESLKKRDQKSDRAEAFILTFAGSAVSASVASSTNGVGWRTPLKRNIRGIV